MRLLIVNFHYFREIKPRSGIYPVTSKAFSCQLETLAKSYKFISNAELVEFISAEKKPKGNFCLITFDDGLREQLNALDILNRLSIPAVFFVTTQPLVDRKVHDVHKTHYVYSHMGDDEILQLLDARHNIRECKFDTALLNEEYRYDTLEKKKIKFFLNFLLTQEERHVTIDYLFSQISSNEGTLLNELYMDKQDIITLAKRGMLGTHTKSHLPLARLRASKIADEIVDSSQVLESITGCKIDGVSYPYGGPAAISQKVANIARSKGMQYGLTMIRGVNHDADICKGMMLYRVDTNDAPGGKCPVPEFTV